MFLRGIQLEAHGRHINWDKRDGIAILSFSFSLSPPREIEFERIEEKRGEGKKKKRKERKILEEKGTRKILKSIELNQDPFSNRVVTRGPTLD